jgi:hypothetical protein
MTESGGMGGVPPSDERARTRIGRALGVAEPHPGLRSRVVASMPIDVESTGARWPWTAGAGAVVLALAIVATLIVVRQGPTVHSASAGRPIGALNMATQVGFRCSLPVASYATEARISLPDGGVTLEKALDPQQGKGGFSSAYAAGKWLPVPTSWVSPDGRSYAYTTVTSGVPGKQPTSALFVHDVSTGRDRRLWSGESNGQVLGWGPGGIYFSRQPVNQAGPASPEVWVVDPADPARGHRVGPNPPQSQASDPTQPTIYWSFQKIAGGAAWGTASGPVIKGTAGSPSGAPPSRIDRMDLRDGSVTTWYAAPDGMSVGLAGADAQGHPVLVLNVGGKGQAVPAPSPSTNPTLSVPPPPQVLLLTGPNQTRTIADGSDAAFRPGLAASDSHGIWFSSPGSLWLYRNGSLTKVADVPSDLFPTPTPPTGVSGKSGLGPGSPPGYPTGVTLNLVGACT